MTRVTPPGLPDDDELVQRAMRNYWAWCEHNGYLPLQPCRYSSGVEGRHVVLRNVNGELARFRMTRMRRLRLLTSEE